MPKPTDRPARVRLTQDFLDFVSGEAYPEGTVLIKNPHNGYQYVREGQSIGTWCIAGFDLICNICEILEP